MRLKLIRRGMMLLPSLGDVLEKKWEEESKLCVFLTLRGDFFRLFQVKINIMKEISSTYNVAPK